MLNMEKKEIKKEKQAPNCNTPILHPRHKDIPIESKQIIINDHVVVFNIAPRFIYASVILVIVNLVQR